MCRAVLTPWLGLLLLNSAVCGSSVTLPVGPIEEWSILDDFGTNSRLAWTITSGENISWHSGWGGAIPGVVDSALQLDLVRKDPKEVSSGKNWVSLKRGLGAGSLPAQADGLRLLLGSAAGGEWWMSISLRSGEKTYSHSMQPVLPPRSTTEHVVPWAEFKCEGKPLTADNALRVVEITLDFSANGSSLYLEKITTYHQQVYGSWLTFESSHPSNNIFEVEQPVKASLKTGGTPPASATGFRYELSDFFGTSSITGKIGLGPSGTYNLDLTPRRPGYYELRAYWVDSSGKDLENRSCLLAEGTVPAGLATLAVMPCTAAQNIARFQKLGTNAFFGLHGDFMGLANLMGLCWRLDYSRWQFLEPDKPDRSQGMAGWARDLIRDQPPKPAYEPAILPLCGNFAPPEWAKNKTATATPYARWEDYLAMVQDYVEAKKHLYPQMNPRIYGVAWEVNLNMPPSNFWPPYSPQDIVELHRRTRETIQAVDPRAILIGPCPSNLNPEWFETVFKAGLLDYVDGIEAHGYAEGTFSPEENDYPGKLARLKDLTRRYHHGQVLPIYITEAAFRGMSGSKIIYHIQAEVMTRLAIILKGEGVRTFLPFYGIDYDRDGWWGFCFNLEVDHNPWGTKRISPKPTVNAMATCAAVLEGATPVKRVRGLGDDIWAYLFDREGTRILTIWNPKLSATVHVNTGKVREVQVLDIMGNRSSLRPEKEQIVISVDTSPKYVIGLGKDL